MHSQEYSELENRYEASRKRLQEQIDQLQEQKQEIELSLNTKLDDALVETQALKD
jgi:hypothetical protein